MATVVRSHHEPLEHHPLCDALAGFKAVIKADEEDAASVTLTEPTLTPELSKPELQAAALPVASASAVTKHSPAEKPKTVPISKPGPNVKLAPDAPFDAVPFGQFLEFDAKVLGVVIDAIRAKGKRPVVSFELEAGAEYSRVNFGLAMLPNDRVQMTVLGGVGFFAAIFPVKSIVFRDEIFFPGTAQPLRSAISRGLHAFLELILSLRDARG